MKKLRFILFIPVCMATLGILNWTFLGLLNWTVQRTTQWYIHLDIIYFILLIPLFWGAIWSIFKICAICLAALPYSCFTGQKILAVFAWIAFPD